MILVTDSGRVRINKRSRYGAWLEGRIAAGSWTGTHTVQMAWGEARPAVNATRTRREAFLIGQTQGIAYDKGKRDGELAAAKEAAFA